MTFIMAAHLPHSQLMPVRADGVPCLIQPKTNRLWSISECLKHVNVQELKAILFGLMALVNQTGLHIKALSDNTTTAVSGVNKTGTLRIVTQ